MYQLAEGAERSGREIPYFRVAGGEVPTSGVDLKINQLAGRRNDNLSEATGRTAELSPQRTPRAMRRP